MYVSTIARRIGFAAATTVVLAASVVGVTQTNLDAAVADAIAPAVAISASAASNPAGADVEPPAQSSSSPSDLQDVDGQPNTAGDATQVLATEDHATEEHATEDHASEVVPEPPTFITAEQLAAIVPQIPSDKVTTYAGLLNAAMVSGGIDSPVRKAAFVAQLVVESDSFRTFEEYASGRAYEGRAELGNTQPGDGERYKGRGAIQVTGRHNYESVSQATGIDFVSNPELVAAPEYAFTTAVWYWTSRHLNQTADNSGIVRVSELVNGGHHGLAERLACFQRGLDVLTRM